MLNKLDAPRIIVLTIITTKVAHNGHGHFLVKKSVESRSLEEWRTDVFMLRPRR